MSWSRGNKIFLLLVAILFISGVIAFAPSPRSRRATALTTLTTSTTLGAIPLFEGAEDVIFSAQNAASNLANSVISSPGTSVGAGGQLRSLLILYIAGLWTSFSPCSLGLLPITISYITNAAKERQDKSTILPTLAFATGLAVVFTALGVSASALGSVFGGSSSAGGDTLQSLLLAAASSLVCILMGMQLLDLIQIPLPSLDFKWRAAFDTKGRRGRANGSLFDENGGLVLVSLQSEQEGEIITDEESIGNELAALLRVCFLGCTSALVASPCATPVLASLLAYLASAASEASSVGDTLKGAYWMLSYTLGYSTPLLLVGATGGQALINLQKSVRDGSMGSFLAQLVTPLSGGVLISFGVNGFLVALLGDPSLAGLAPIIE